jgi:hypothetical protein
MPLSKAPTPSYFVVNLLREASKGALSFTSFESPAGLSTPALQVLALSLAMVQHHHSNPPF